jgi:hypothetical protein
MHQVIVRRGCDGCRHKVADLGIGQARTAAAVYRLRRLGCVCVVGGLTVLQPGIKLAILQRMDRCVSSPSRADLV